MTITPQDLRNPRFRHAFRGLSRSAVREALRAVTPEFEAAALEVERLRGELAAAGSRLVAAQAKDRNATRVLAAAEQDASRLRKEAEIESARIVAGAERRAALLLQEAEAERDLLAGRIAACHEHRRRMAVLLEGEVDALAGFLAAEPVLAPPHPVPLETLPPPAPPAPDTPDAGDATWSADDVARALAAVTGRGEEEADGIDRAGGAGPATDGREIDTALQDGGPAPMGAGGWFRRARWPAAAAAAALIVTVLARPGARQGPEARPAAGRPETPVAAASLIPPPAAQPAAPAAPRTDAAQAPPLPEGTLRVTLEAIRPCWIRLTANGRAEERVLQPGESITRDSTTDVVVRAGNAGALVVTVNGRTLAPLGREGETITRRLTASAAR